MAGFPTSNRIWEETLLAKRAYKKVLAQAGQMAKHYHADNGRFSDKGFH
jgi:hypothetical protein